MDSLNLDIKAELLEVAEVFAAARKYSKQMEKDARSTLQKCLILKEQISTGPLNQRRLDHYNFLIGWLSKVHLRLSSEEIEIFKSLPEGFVPYNDGTVRPFGKGYEALHVRQVDLHPLVVRTF